MSYSNRLAAAIREEIVAAVRHGASRAITAGINAYYTNGPGKQLLTDALDKSLAASPIHI